MNIQSVKEQYKRLQKYLPYILFAVLLGLFAVTRLWRLVSIPYGNHIDEAGVAYDAWCISQYGVDRYMKSFPLYFQNTGGGQSVLCTYMTALLYKIFGYHQVMVRIPGVIYSFLTMIFTMLIVRKLYPKRPYLPLAAGFLVTICPVFILFARLGMDCHMMLGGSAMFLYFFILAMTDGRYRYYLLAGLTGGLVLYTYVLSYMMLPLFLVFGFVYMLAIHKFQFKKWVVMGIPIFVMAVPLFMIQLINLMEWPEMQVGIFSLTRLIGYRSAELEGFSWSNISNVLSTLLVGDSLEYSSIPGFENLYWLSFPFACLGFGHSIYKTVISIRKRSVDILSLCLLWFAAVFLIMCGILNIVYRMNSIFFVVVVFIVDGIAMLPSFLSWIGGAIKSGVAIGYMLLFLEFFSYYYMGQYTADYYTIDIFNIDMREGFAFIDEHPEYGPKGVQAAARAIHVALSSLKSPYELGEVYLETIYLKDGYYHCNCLSGSEEGYYYVVRDIFTEFAAELRSHGFTERKYTNYSLFYKEP